MRDKDEGGTGSQLSRARRSLEQWRREFGGPGRPIPAKLWEQAAAIARVEGVDATARALRLDRQRLACRVGVAAESPSQDPAPSCGEFVEIDARGLLGAEPTVVRLVGRDGERLEIALRSTSALDVVTLARAFWDRTR